MYINTFKYKPEDVSCVLCTEYVKKLGCTAPSCPCLVERMEAGTVGYAEAVAELFPYRPRLTARIMRLAESFPGTMWQDGAHRKRMETLRLLLGEIRAFNRHYLSRGLCLLPLRFTEGKALLYLYRPAALRRDLREQTAEALLADAGYPCGSCGGCVARLVRRMREGAEFPHEVGLFLSYPPEDVKGFIENRAANAKCTGVWKVYGDERQARQTFDRYKKCTQTYCERWRSGVELDRLAVADRIERKS